MQNSLCSCEHVNTLRIDVGVSEEQKETSRFLIMWSDQLHIHQSALLQKKKVFFSLIPTSVEVTQTRNVTDWKKKFPLKLLTVHWFGALVKRSNCFNTKASVWRRRRHAASTISSQTPQLVKGEECKHVNSYNAELCSSSFAVLFYTPWLLQMHLCSLSLSCQETIFSLSAVTSRRYKRVAMLTFLFSFEMIQKLFRRRARCAL